MRKFLKTCHVIARIFLILCIAAVLLLYFFKPGILELVKTVLPAANNAAWLAVVTTLSLAAVMFAAAELAYKGLNDNEFLGTLSSSILKPAYEAFDLDLSDKRFSKIESGELDFNASLRDVTDGKERMLRELAWERQHCRKLQKKTVGNCIVVLLFFLTGLAFVLYPIIFFLVTGKLMGLPVGTGVDYVSIAALILAVVMIFECGSNQGYQRRLNTIVSIRTRSDDYMRMPAALPGAFSVPEEHIPAAVPVVKPEPAEKPAAQENTVQEAPKPAAEETWKPEPAWTGVPEEQVMEMPHENPFVIMTPGEEKTEETDSAE